MSDCEKRGTGFIIIFKCWEKYCLIESFNKNNGARRSFFCWFAADKAQTPQACRGLLVCV